MTFWLPDVLYIHTGDTAATRLRGLAMYRELVGEFTRDDGGVEFVGRGEQPTHAIAGHDTAAMWVVASNRLPVERPAILRVLAPSDRRFVDLIEQRRANYVVIVDVHHPVDTLDETFGVETDPALAQLDLDMTRELWRPGGKRHAQLVRALRFADAVTCPPNPYTVGDARTYNDHVWVVPDLIGESEEAIETFSDALTPALRDAAERFAERRVTGEAR